MSYTNFLEEVMEELREEELISKDNPPNSFKLISITSAEIALLKLDEKWRNFYMNKISGVMSGGNEQ